MGALLRAIAKVPAGEKLRIGDMARSLDITQADVIGAVEALIAERRLDPKTLRPPLSKIEPEQFEAVDPGGCAPPVLVAKAVPEAQASRELTANEMADAVEACIAEHGLCRSRVSRHLFRAFDGLTRLRAVKSPQAVTIERVKAFLANPPSDEFRPRPRGPGPRGRQGGRSETQAAAVRRSIGRQATALLDGDKSQLTTGGVINQAVRGAMRMIEDQRAAEARKSDPAEQAKLALRSRGRVVFNASVTGGRDGRFFVSGEVDEDGKRIQLDVEALTRLAWRVNPLRMKQLTEAAQ
jgi:hypothetical protein